MRIDTEGLFSRPRKMPWLCWSIPATECKTGGKLRSVSGSVCSNCYAFKGCYRWNSTERALARRMAEWKDDPARWTATMLDLLGKKAKRADKRKRFFRWFDSGDLQSLGMLRAIVTIARRLPEIAFWLPTKERGIVRRFLKSGSFPANLCVRVSATMIGRAAGSVCGLPTSTVSAGIGVECKAPGNGGECGDCRACWDRSIENVDYREH